MYIRMENKKGRLMVSKIGTIRIEQHRNKYISTGNANGFEELRAYPANVGEANDL